VELGRRLLRRPRPYADESLAGYIIRLTEANYYCSPHWILQMSGLRSRGIYANVFNKEKDDLSGLSHICEVEESRLWSMAFPVVNLSKIKSLNTVKGFGQVISTIALTNNQAKVCPICLKESPYSRQIWDLSVVTACPFHDCLLIHRCPQCHLQIKGSRPSVAKCQCQFDWRELHPRALKSERVALSRHIYKLCQIMGLPSGNSSDVSPANPVSQLSLNSLVNLLNALLRLCHLLAIREQVFPVGAYLDLKSNSLGYFDRVFALFTNWPDEFGRLVERYEVYLGYGNPNWYITNGFYRGMVEFFQFVFLLFDQDSWGFMRELFEDYFFQFLSKNSIKELQISFKKPFECCLISSSVGEQASLKERLANFFLKEGFTLAKLLATSKTEIYDETIFFRIPYLPDLLALKM
jgi:hypothetical protein